MHTVGLHSSEDVRVYGGQFREDASKSIYRDVPMPEHLECTGMVCAVRYRAQTYRDGTIPLQITVAFPVEPMALPFLHKEESAILTPSHEDNARYLRAEYQ